MQLEGPEHLREWLTKNLQTICDADPAALAKYVMALLKKDKPEKELRDFCVDQLDVFLQAETKKFVEKLFAAVGDQSYLPESKRQPKAPAKTAEATLPTPVEPLKQSQPQQQASADISINAPSSGKTERVVRVAKERKDSPSESSTDRHHRTAGKSHEQQPSSTYARETSSSRSQRKRISPPRDDQPSSSTKARVDRPQRMVVEPSSTTGGGGSRRSRSRSRERERSGGLQRRLGAQRQTDRRGRDRGGGGDADGRRVTRRHSRSRSPRSRSPRERKEKSDKSKDKQSNGAVVVSTKEDDGIKDKRDKFGRAQRCRDYDEKGFCMLGEVCPYDHGPDPVVVDHPEDLPKMIQMRTPAANAPPGHPMPNLSVPPPGYTPLNPPPPGVDAVFTSAAAVSAAEGYNPEKPQLSDVMTSTTAVPLPASLMLPPPGFNVPPPPLGHSRWPAPPPPGYATLPPPQGAGSDMGAGVRPHGIKRNMGDSNAPGGVPYHSFPKRGRGRGGHVSQRLGGPPFMTRQQREQNATLKVCKVPIKDNKVVELSKHFSRFGDIKNIQIGVEDDRESSLITFANHWQAQQAYRSTDPILNNRFIRVFWHGQPVETQTAENEPGQSQRNVVQREQQNVLVTARGGLTKTLYNPSTLSAVNRPSVEGKQDAATSEGSAVDQGRTVFVAPGKSTSSTMRSGLIASQRIPQESYVQQKKRRKLERVKRATYMELWKKKTDILTKTLDEQKTLFKMLDKAKEPEKKKELSKMIKTVDKQAADLKVEISDIQKKLNALNAASNAAEGRTKQQIVREQQDVEKEITAEEQAGNDTTSLKQKLDALKQELVTARDEGRLPTSTPVQAAAQRILRRSSSSSLRRSPRLIPTTANLDKRPRNVVVIGFLTAERDLLVQHMQQFGELEDYEFDKDKDGVPRATVTYRARKDAEQAIELASDFNDRHIAVRWAAQIRRRTSSTTLQQALSASSSSADNKSTAASKSAGQTDTANAKETSGLFQSGSTSAADVVVPDVQRDPSEQVTATQLLASIGGDDDSDAEGSLLSGDGALLGDDDALLDDDELVQEPPL